MKCRECGTECEDTAKFCKSCGAPIQQEVKKTSNIFGNDSKPIIITIIAIVAIIIIGVGVYASGVFTPDVPLNTQDFGAFKVDVPKGSDFVVKDSVTTDPKKVMVSYENKGKYSDELTIILVANNASSIDNDNDDEIELVETDGNMKVYKYKEADGTGVCCFAHVDDGDNQFEAIGYDLNTVKRVAKTFKAGDMNQLKNNVTPLTEASSSSSSAPASSTPSSISILGGSFSTGSADADKTYARINVGTAHAGEDVIVQIFYSRDGNSLNNGNMVPATVHSDGYL